VEVRLPPESSDALTGVEMFAGLEPEARQRVVAAAVPCTYRKGQVLFEEDDPGDSLIVLKRGAVVAYCLFKSIRFRLAALTLIVLWLNDVGLLDRILG
jgi:hypothetical protein